MSKTSDKSPFRQFKTFIKNELDPATKELENLKSEKSRKHLQKLVYTNLVDRFDLMVDNAILKNATHLILLEEGSKRLDSNFSQSDFIKTVLNEKGIENIAKEMLENSLRESLLRQRHSKKLFKICEIFSAANNSNQEFWTKPRVNDSTGRILKSFKPQRNVPVSVCGYADYLYSRRNTIVHGSGTLSFLDNDYDQMKKLFKANTIGKRFNLSLSSIKNTRVFYESLIEQLEK